MASIGFKQFKGSTPRVADHLVQQPYASVAMDCKFWHGDLSSWYEPRKTDDLPQEDGYKYVMMGCCFVKLPLCATVAEGDPNCKKYYVTGRTAYPEEAHVDFNTCEITWYRLGLPCPYQSPQAFAEEDDDELNRDAESRTYVYQFVNSRGQKSAASPPSQPLLLMNEGHPVTVSGWEIPDASWDVKTVRIYRSVAGMESGKEAGNAFDTTYMFVGEVPLDAGSFVDTKYAYDLFDALEEGIVMPPNADMQGITAVASMNIYAGFSGNKLYFSKNNEPNNWSIDYTLDDNICGIAESGGLLYVITDGHPYVVSAAADCKTADCRKITRHLAPMPMLGCGGRHIATTPNGIFYPTIDGLAWLVGDNPPSIITAAAYAPDDWQRLLPETAVPVFHKGYLFVFAKGGSFVLQIGSKNSSGWDADYHSSLSDKDVYYAFVSRNGNFYIEKPDGIYLWNASTVKRPHRWVSAEAVTGVPMNFGAVKLYMSGAAERVKIKSDDRYIFDREVVRANQPMALPLWGTGQRFYFELEGTADVKLLAVATSVKELPA